MNFARLKDLIITMLLGGFQRLKPERIQGQSAVPGETPMTAERIGNRAAESGYELVWAPVAIRKRYRHQDFGGAVAFVATEIEKVAAEEGHSPKVEIDGGVVTVTLGIPIPALVSEADFDFADALKAAAAVDDDPADPESDPEADFEADSEANPRNG